MHEHIALNQVAVRERPISQIHSISRPNMKAVAK